MKRSIGNDGQSASAPNAPNPAFLVGVKVFSKGATAGPGTNPDTMVYVPCPHVLNPFVSDDARNSYGYVAGDSAFIVTITREFMLANLGHTGDHGLLEGFHDEVTPDEDGVYKRQLNRHTLGSFCLVLGDGGIQTSTDPVRAVFRIVAERHMKAECRPLYFGAGINCLLNTYPCVRNRVYEACPQSITSAGLWPLERNGTSYAKAGPVGDEDLKGPYSARGRLEHLALTSPQGVLRDSWGHTAQQQ